MSRVSEKQKDSVVEPSESSGSEESDEEDAQDEEVDDGTPDLYRNSSLGMYVFLHRWLYVIDLTLAFVGMVEYVFSRFSW